MKINDQTSSAAQAVSAENREYFMSRLRDSLRATAEQMLEEEVNALCGESHRPEAGAQYRRAGSESGTCYAEGRREAILRPRVRKRNGMEGSASTCWRATPPCANEQQRGVGGDRAGGWHEHAQPSLGQRGGDEQDGRQSPLDRRHGHQDRRIAERDLRQTAFFGLILDGVFVGDGAVVLIALGLTCTGEKMLLDFEVGSSENAVVSTALVARLQRRGFGPSPGCRLFAVLDGAVALESAVLALWPDACVQRCLVHKERNLYGYLRKGDHAEAARLWQAVALGPGRSGRPRSTRAIAYVLAPAQCRRHGQPR